MATINSLMKHLRANGVHISGSTQKRKLREIGYYHGYKGYRFAGKASNRLPIGDFDEIVALHDFDMGVKSLFYSRLMQVETALKNRVLEAVLAHSPSERFEDVYRSCLTAYKCCGKKAYRAAWSSRLRLRTEVYQLIAANHDRKAVIGHFRDLDRDVPIWAIFEVMMLGTFGLFYSCLHEDIKREVCDGMGMPSGPLDSSSVLKKMIFAFKDLRNAVAHNGVVLDVRFKTGAVHKTVGELLEGEMELQGVDFGDIVDYALMLAYLMAGLGFTKTECKQFLQGFEELLERHRNALPYDIYSQYVKTQTRAKLAAARDFVSQRL